MGVEMAVIVDNELLANTAASFPNTAGGGGAVGLWGSRNVQLQDNRFRQNVGSANGEGHGGAVIVSESQAITMAGNRFDENWAAMFGILTSAGGAVELGASQDLVVADNQFHANMAALYSGSTTLATSGEGGALVGYAVDDLLVATNVFSGNVTLLTGVATAGSEGIDGGALAINRGAPASGLAASAPDGASTRVHITGNQFLHNTVMPQGAGDAMIVAGGAVRLTAVGTTVAGNYFFDNATCRSNCAGQANNGGALAVLPALEADFVTSADAVVDGNTFVANRGGNGMAMLFLTNLFTVTNNLVAGNLGDGGAAPNAVNISLYVPIVELLPARIANNTLYANAGAGLFFDGWDDRLPPVVNNIIVSHTEGVVAGDEETVVDLRYNLFNDNGVDIAGPGTITNVDYVMGPVRFVDAAQGLFYLMPNSMAIDAGDPQGAPPAPDHDIDGAPRPYGGRADIGAYEWHGQGSILGYIAK
jgi:hypothetical protein